jgi:hypothetical protein
LGLPTFTSTDSSRREVLGFEVLGFEALGFDGFGFVTAVLRLVAVGRFAAFRTRLAMFPLVEA